MSLISVREGINNEKYVLMESWTQDHQGGASKIWKNISLHFFAFLEAENKY